MNPGAQGGGPCGPALRGPHVVPEGGHFRPTPQRPLRGGRLGSQRVYSPQSQPRGFVPLHPRPPRGPVGAAQGSPESQIPALGPLAQGGQPPRRWAVPSETRPSGQPDPLESRQEVVGPRWLGCLFPARLKYSLLAGGSGDVLIPNLDCLSAALWRPGRETAFPPYTHTLPSSPGCLPPLALEHLVGTEVRSCPWTPAPSAPGHICAVSWATPTLHEGQPAPRHSGPFYGLREFGGI